MNTETKVTTGATETTYDIELPPLPKGDIAADTCPVIWVHSNAQLQAYARAAIEADRKHRGEPVSKTDWNNELSSWGDEDFIHIFHERPDLANRLRKILAEPVKSTCKECNGTGVESTRFHGVWSNGEECLEPIKCDQCDGFGTTSVAEPVKSYLTVKYDDKGDYLYICCDSNEAAEAEENEQGILLWRAYSDGRLVGVTIPNFIGPNIKPVKVDAEASVLSDADAKYVQDFINCDGMGAVIVEGPQYSAVVRALLARYTTR